MIDNRKPLIIMQPGPLHLFWTTGIFYLWGLKTKFDFILIVSYDYKHNSLFQKKIKKISNIRKVIYMPKPKLFLQQIALNCEFKKLLKAWPPQYIILNNVSYIENQYLIHWAKIICPSVKRFYFQNGRMNLRWKSDFSNRRAIQIEALLNKYPFASKSREVLCFLIDLKIYLTNIIEFSFMPLFIIGSIFCPPVNVRNGSVNISQIKKKLQSNINNDYLLAYFDVEIKAYKELGFSKIIQIVHPVQNNYSEVHKYLYGNFKETKSILLLPGYGYTSKLLVKGYDAEKLICSISIKWCDAINLLLEKFRHYDLKIKLHPTYKQDFVSVSILKRIRRSFPKLELIDAKESAERHVLLSSVIVSDVSTVLWWASFLRGKTVISLDIFNYEDGDEMNEYDGIYYISNLNDINKIKPEYMAENCSINKSRSDLLDVFI